MMANNSLNVYIVHKLHVEVAGPYDMWPQKEKMSEIVGCMGDSQIRRWFAEMERRQF